jgi:hypothetical protein
VFQVGGEGAEVLPRLGQFIGPVPPARGLAQQALHHRQLVADGPVPGAVFLPHFHLHGFEDGVDLRLLRRPAREAPLGQALHGEQHDVAVELPLEFATQVDLPLSHQDVRAEFGGAGVRHGAPVQHGQVGGDEPAAHLGAQHAPHGGAGHAQAQRREGDEPVQGLGPEHVVAGIDGARRLQAGQGVRMAVPGDPGRVLAVEKAVQPAREGREAVGVARTCAPIAGDIAMKAIGIGGVAEAEQIGHVVVGGVARAARIEDRLAVGPARLGPGHLAQEADDVVEEIAGHHRRRHRRIAHHLAGEHPDVGAAEYLVQVVEEINRAHLARPRRGRHLDLEHLIAVDGEAQQPGVTGRHPGETQVGDVARHGLALVGESLPGMDADGAGQICGGLQGIQQGELFLQAEVLHRQPLAGEIAGQGPVGGHGGGVPAVVGQQHAHLAVTSVRHAAIAEGAAEFQQAVQAGPGLARVVRHRDDDDEAVAFLVSLDQRRFQFPVRRLAGRQQGLVQAAGP